MVALAWFNFGLCIVGVLVNAVYIVKCKEFYKWIKLLNAASCLFVGLNYWEILTHGAAGTIQLRFATSLMLLSIVGGGVISLARLPVSQWEIRLWRSSSVLNSLLRRGNERWQ